MPKNKNKHKEEEVEVAETEETPAAEGAEGAEPEATEELTDGEEEETPAEDSKTWKRLSAAYEASPNACLRMVNFHYARKLLNQPDMTWVGYCDMKIKAFTDCWEAKKTNPEAGKAIRVLTPDQLKKHQEEMVKLQARMERMNKAIAMSTAAATPAATPKK